MVKRTCGLKNEQPSTGVSLRIKARPASLEGDGCSESLGLSDPSNPKVLNPVKQIKLPHCTLQTLHHSNQTESTSPRPSIRAETSRVGLRKGRERSRELE